MKIIRYFTQWTVLRCYKDFYGRIAKEIKDSVKILSLDNANYIY